MNSKIVTLTAIASLLMVACTSNNDNVDKVETNKPSTMSKNLIAGKSLYHASCTKCHSTSVHTRADRTVKSLDSLKKRVAKCNVNVGSNLTTSEVDAVSQYLNSTYYKFQ